MSCILTREGIDVVNILLLKIVFAFVDIEKNIQGSIDCLFNQSFYTIDTMINFPLLTIRMVLVNVKDRI